MSRLHSHQQQSGHISSSTYSQRPHSRRGDCLKPLLFSSLLAETLCSPRSVNLSLFISVQKPEKLSSVCVAGALLDGIRAYTALHTHARIAAGHTLLVMDGASVCIMQQNEMPWGPEWRHTRHAICQSSRLVSAPWLPNYFWIYSFAAMFCYPSNKTVLLCVNVRVI